MFKERKYKGVTLIEMLLVIVLLSVLVIYALQTYQDYNTQQNIKKSREQIQLLLNGARTYYNDYFQWPTSLQALVDNHYVDASVLCSPWPRPAKIETFPAGDNNAGQNYSASCPNAQMYYEQIAPPSTCPPPGQKRGGYTTSANMACFAYYGITVQVPSTKIADDLAAYLPTTIHCPLANANVDSSIAVLQGLPSYVACQMNQAANTYIPRVSSFTTRPTVMAQDLSGFVENMGVTSMASANGDFNPASSTMSIPKLDCSKVPGTTAQYFFLPLNYKYSAQLGKRDARDAMYPVNPNTINTTGGDYQWSNQNYAQDFSVYQIDTNNPNYLVFQSNARLQDGYASTNVEGTFIYFSTCLKDSQVKSMLCSPFNIRGTSQYCGIFSPPQPPTS